MTENNQKIYSKQEVKKATLQYFKNDELACDVWMKKYCLKDGENYFELTPDDMHRRLAKEFYSAESKYEDINYDDLSEYGKKRNVLTEEKIFEYFKNFKLISPQGSIMSMLGDKNVVGSLSNCVVVPKIFDSIGGIIYTDQQLAQLSKRRCGVGIDISTLRPANYKVTNAAGTSTGAISFMDRYSNTTREIGQNNRRAALMTSIDVRHPDIFDFIKIKRDLKKVTGSNISVMLRDDFMEAVTNNKKYVLRFPVDSNIEDALVTKEINAVDLWNEIIISAHLCAEPGLIFKDRQHLYSTSSIYPNWTNISTNPCCFSVNSEVNVITNNGIKEIKNIDSNDLIWVDDKKEWVKTSGYFNVGKHKTYKVVFENNEEFITTDNHKYPKVPDSKSLLNFKLTELKDLKIGDKIKLHVNEVENYNWPNLGTYEDGLILGQSDNENNHDTLLKYSKEFIKGYLSAYFTSKGIISYNMSKFYLLSNNQNILKQIKYLLNIWGIKTTVSLVKRRKQNRYRLLIIGKINILRFIKNIGFLSNEKITTCIEMIKNIDELDKNINQCEHTRIKSIEFYDESEVGCISLEKYNYFTANGILVGNSEIAMNDDSCRLMIVNYYGCVKNPFTEHAEFDFDKLYEISYEAQRLIDDLVDLELIAVNKIIDKVNSDPEPDYIKAVELETWKNLYNKGKAGRRTGLGFTGIGDVFASLGLKYDSDEAMKLLNKISETKFLAEFNSSIDMAIQRGKFNDFNPEHENKSEFVLMIKNEYPDLYQKMMKFGRRNISISTVAPTGSLSILTQTTSGIEPLFMTGYKRRKKISLNEKNIKIDFVDDMGDSWAEFEVLHPRLKEWQEINNVRDVNIKNPYVGSTASEIDWIKRIKIQSIVQKYVTHSISSTINLPKDVTPEKVGEIYLEAWKMKLKGITVYRDGSRDGVLISNTDTKKNVEFHENHAPKRPKRLKGEIYRFQNNLEKWVAVVGLKDGKPYELFTGLATNGIATLSPNIKECEIVKNIIETEGLDDNGKLAKIRKKRYDIEYIDLNGVKQVHEGINQAFNPEFWNYAKLISGILRHGMPLTSAYELINSLNFKEEYINTWKNGVVRVIKRYIKDGEKGKGKCPECGSEQLEFKESCLTCMNCGNSKCS